MVHKLIKISTVFEKFGVMEYFFITLGKASPIQIIVFIAKRYFNNSLICFILHRKVIFIKIIRNYVNNIYKNYKE